MSRFQAYQQSDASAFAAAASARPACAASFRIRGLDTAGAAVSIFLSAARICRRLLGVPALLVRLPARKAGGEIRPVMACCAA